jgi:transketolase
LGRDGKPTDEPAVSLEDIRRFRQFHSRCPGHPEYGETSGVETTTGPLGQGIGNSVGMAIASRWLAAHFNRPGFKLFDYNVYALSSDGDLMEGVGAEAASIAGHLRLSNLCWIYDDNKITIEGKTSLAFSEDVAKRFAGYGFHVVKVDDVNDLAALRAALKSFVGEGDRHLLPEGPATNLRSVPGSAQKVPVTFSGPTLIIVRSVIAWGSPHKANTHGAHGAALGEDEVRLTKKVYGWPEDAHFLVPDEVLAQFREGIGRRGRQLREAWEEQFARYKAKYPDLAEQLELLERRELPQGWDADIPEFPADAKGMASRVSSGKVLNQVAKHVPWLLGGSADLAPSNNSTLTFEGAGDFQADNYAGRNFHFGIREHAMAAVCNGMTLCGLRAYGATFFVFTDYLRPSMRLAALMGLPVFYILTHDSIGVGEDGPTHQPIEHLAALRAIPNLSVIRPADANEVAEAYKAIMRLKCQPAALVLTRQNLPTLDRTKFAPASGLQKGGYVLADPPDAGPQVILIASGSEVSLCVGAYEQLGAEGIKARVVSLPCWELFDAQPAEYRDAVLPPAITARVGVEAGVEQGWSKYLGPGGRFIGLGSFGASAPAGVLMKHFGLTAENVVAAAKELKSR